MPHLRARIVSRLPGLCGSVRRMRRLPLAPEHLDPARASDALYAPLVAVWELTLRCDLACRHCGSRAGRARHGELTTAECLDLVRDLAELGTREVTLIGGEAYLRDDWLDVIRAIAECGMLPTLVTGGRGMTPERARRAAAAGLRTAGVSVDGEASAHDRLRGVAGSHRSAFEALGHLRAAGIAIAVNTQVNRLTRRDLEPMLERIALAGARSWQLVLTVPMGRAADDPSLLLQPYDLLELFPLLDALFTRAAEMGVDVVCGNNVGYFGPYERTLRGKMAAGYAGSCGAGITTLGIEADGTIKGCPSLATRRWAGGTIRHAPLRAIWERSPRLRFMRDRVEGIESVHATEPALWGFCATCYYARECRGGCTWMSDSLFGRPGNNPYCHHRALELKERGRRERVERVEVAPGESFDHGRFEIVEEDLEPVTDVS